MLGSKKTTQPSEPNALELRATPLATQLCLGLIFGVSLLLLLETLGGLSWLGSRFGVAAIAFLVIAVWIQISRLRAFNLISFFALLCFLGVVAFTPLVPSQIGKFIRVDPPGKIDALVTLSSGNTADDHLGYKAVARLLSGMQSAQTLPLILTKVGFDGTTADADTQELVAKLNPGRTVFRVGPVFDTHDEAVEVAKLCAQQGFKTIELITSPLHSKRAAETFEAVGLTVISRPCVEREFALWLDENGKTTASTLLQPIDRIIAFRALLYEAVGAIKYRYKGWTRARP